MQDRVAEVLAQRQALESGAAAGVVLSVFLHTAAAAIVVYAAVHHAPPQQVTTLTIDIAPMAAPTPAPKHATAAPKTPIIQEPKPVVETPPKPAVKPEPKTVAMSPFGQSPKKGSEHPAPAPVAPVAPVTPATTTAAQGADVAVGTAGVASIDGDFPYTIYIQNMNRLIGSHWTRPEVKPGTNVKMFFTINRDGSIRDVNVEGSSGNTLFDRAAQRALLETSPLPPLPFAYNGTYLGVHLIFK